MISRPTPRALFPLLTLCAASSLAASISLRAQDPVPAQPPAAQPSAETRQFTPDEQTAMRRGGTIYRELCFTCHGPDGKGAAVPTAPGAEPPPGGALMMGPPLAGSPRVQGPAEYVIYVLLHGLIGPLEGKTYISVMMPMGANNDEWIAAAASFARNGFGNTGSFVTPADVAKARAATADRKTPWTLEELKTAVPALASGPPK